VGRVVFVKQSSRGYKVKESGGLGPPGGAAVKPRYEVWGEDHQKL